MTWFDSDNFSSDSEAVLMFCEKADGATFDSDRHYSESEHLQRIQHKADGMSDELV